MQITSIAYQGAATASPAATAPSEDDAFLLRNFAILDDPQATFADKAAAYAEWIDWSEANRNYASPVYTALMSSRNGFGKMVQEVNDTAARFNQMWQAVGLGNVEGVTAAFDALSADDKVRMSLAYYGASETQTRTMIRTAARWVATEEQAASGGPVHRNFAEIDAVADAFVRGRDQVFARYDRMRELLGPEPIIDVVELSQAAQLRASARVSEAAGGASASAADSGGLTQMAIAYANARSGVVA